MSTFQTYNQTKINDLLNSKANIATTLSGYGITDAKIASGTIILGDNTITPLVSENFTHPTEIVQSLGSKSSNFEVNTTNGNVATATIAGNCTITLSGATAGYATTCTLILTNGGNYYVTWNNASPCYIKWNKGTKPDLTKNGTDILTFICFDGINWYGVGATALA